MFNLDSALGVEIREDRLVLASVQKGFQDFTLKNYLVVDHFRDLNRPELLGRIKGFVRNNGFNRENVILGLQREVIVVRDLEFPIEVEENLDQVVRSQVDKFEPIEDQRSYFDYRVVSRDQENSRIKLQVVMVRSGLVDELLDLFSDLDLYPAAIRFSSAGLEAALAAHDDGTPKKAAPVLVARVDSNSLEVVAMSAEQATFSDMQQLPQEQTDARQSLNVIAELLTPVAERFESFEKVYLVGDRAASLVDEFQQQLGDCELFRSKLSLRGKKTSKDTLDGLVAAIGLAVSGIVRSSDHYNLIPESKRVISARPNLVPSYILAALLILLLGALGTRGYVQQKALAGQVDTQIDALQSQVDTVFDVREAVTRKREELMELRDLLSGRQGALLVLKDLTERIPDDTYLQNLQIQGDRLTMQGYSDQASNLLPLLLESPYLASVKTNWITQDPRRGSGKERFNFSAEVAP